MSSTLSVGLTGGIASGKSAVAARMEELGAVVIDADLLAREALQPGSEGLAEVVEAFGASLLNADGTLNRSALGQVVFNDDDARARLNSIVHPRVRAAAAQRREAAPEGSVVVEDIPLLVETGQQDRFDVVVVVHAPEELRVQRMVERRGMSSEAARARIRAQATDAQRAEAADVLLENSGSREDLLAEVDKLMTLLSQRAHSSLR